MIKDSELRSIIAMVAMHGLLSCNKDLLNKNGNPDFSATNIANLAWSIADAFIAEGDRLEAFQKDKQVKPEDMKT